MRRVSQNEKPDIIYKHDGSAWVFEPSDNIRQFLNLWRYSGAVKFITSPHTLEQELKRRVT